MNSDETTQVASAYSPAIAQISVNLVQLCIFTHNSGLQESFCIPNKIMLHTFLYCLRLLFISVAGIL